MFAASAISASFVQMFDVAFARRMCCSRVASVSTYARLPSTSTVSPTSRPGMCRLSAIAHDHEADVRPAELRRDAPGLAFTDADVEAVLRPAGVSTPNDVASATTEICVMSGVGLRDRVVVLDHAEEIRRLHGHAERAVVGRAAARRGRCGRPRASPLPRSRCRGSGCRCGPLPGSADGSTSPGRSCSCPWPRDRRAAPPRTARSSRRTATRWRRRGRSAGTGGSDTRRWTAASPAKPRADTACTTVRNSARSRSWSMQAGW